MQQKHRITIFVFGSHQPSRSMDLPHRRDRNRANLPDTRCCLQCKTPPNRTMRQQVSHDDIARRRSLDQLHDCTHHWPYHMYQPSTGCHHRNRRWKDSPDTQRFRPVSLVCQSMCQSNCTCRRACTRRRRCKMCRALDVVARRAQCRLTIARRRQLAAIVRAVATW